MNDDELPRFSDNEDIVNYVNVLEAERLAKAEWEHWKRQLEGFMADPRACPAGDIDLLLRRIEIISDSVRILTEYGLIKPNDNERRRH